MNEQQQIKSDIDKHVSDRFALWAKDSCAIYKTIGVMGGEELMMMLLKMVVTNLAEALDREEFGDFMAMAYDAAKHDQKAQKTGRRV